MQTNSKAPPPHGGKAAWTITTAIPYVNSKPHLGFALEMIQGDVLARFRRAQGYDVRFQAGTDENSLKNVLAAETAGISTQELVSRNAALFLDLKRSLKLSVDDYIRTSQDPRHRPGVERLWQACADKGDFYERPYEGLYCVGCEQFYKPDDLKDGHCPDHGTKPDRICETNTFFRLSRYQDILHDLISTDAIQIVPASRRNETLRWIEDGLDDFSVSRSSERARGWGIPVPGAPDQVIYVWFDALVNYISALGYGDRDPAFDHYWKHAHAREHVIGKGINRFHSVYWTAMLFSAGLPLPTRIYVHGYITVDSRKISKSLANGVDPVPLVERFGADAVRYYLLRHIRTGEDGDFSQDRFEQAYNSELAGQLGNLVHRLEAMVERYEIDIVPRGATDLAELLRDDPLVLATLDLASRVETCVEQYAFHDALSAIWDTIALANKAVADRAPWEKARRMNEASSAAEAALRRQELEMSILGILEAVAQIADCLRPFLPDVAEQILRRVSFDARSGEAPGSASRARQLFPRQDR